LKNTAIGSPITFLYSKFNKHEKTKRLFYEMQGYGDEVSQVPVKYNREIVSKITGLSGKDLMEFMVFCRFSYYDLVRWDSNEIISAIRYKFSEYQYYKSLDVEKKHDMVSHCFHPYMCAVCCILLVESGSIL
jgi:hypothetical protein